MDLIENIIKNNSKLRLSLARACQSEKIMQYFQQLLPDEVFTSIIGVNYVKNIVSVFFNSAEFASKFKYYKLNLLNKLRENVEFSGLINIQTKILISNNNYSHNKKEVLIKNSNNCLTMQKKDIRTLSVSDGEKLLASTKNIAHKKLRNLMQEFIRNRIDDADND